MLLSVTVRGEKGKTHFKLQVPVNNVMFFCEAHYVLPPNSPMDLYQHHISCEFMKCIILCMLCSYYLTSLQVTDKENVTLFIHHSSILVKVGVNPESNPGTLGMRQEHTLNGTPILHANTFTHAFTSKGRFHQVRY